MGYLGGPINSKFPWFKLQQALFTHTGPGAAEWGEFAEKQGPTAPAGGNIFLQPAQDATADAWR